MTISEAFRVFDTYYLIDTRKTDKTRDEYVTRILGKNGFRTVIGDIPVETIGLHHVVIWKLHMRDEGLQPVYINHCISGLRWFLKWLSEKEFQVMPWDKITFEKEPQRKPKTLLAPDEVQRLIDCAKTIRDKAIIDLFFGSGMRSAELLSLDRYEWAYAQVVNEREVATGAEPIWELQVEGKNDKYRAIHFSQSVRNSVDLYLDSREDHYRPLFISQQNRRISYSMVSRMLHATSRKAGLEKRVTQHVFRHSNATELAVAGMPLPVLADHLGHNDSSVTARVYTNEISTIHSRNGYASFHGALKTR